MSVRTTPGATALTRTPCVPTSRASDRVSPMSPAFAAEYAAVSAMPICPRRDAMLTIDPAPRSSIDGRAARHVWKTAVRSVADDRVPHVGRDVEERRDLGQAGVVDEAVDAPEPRDHLGDQRLGLRAVGDVGPERLAVPPASRTRSSVFAPRRAPEIVDGDRGALGRGLDRDRRADPAAAPRHEDDAPGECRPHQATPAVSRPAAASAARIAAVSRLGDRLERRPHDRRLDDPQLAQRDLGPGPVVAHRRPVHDLLERQDPLPDRARLVPAPLDA